MHQCVQLNNILCIVCWLLVYRLLADSFNILAICTKSLERVRAFVSFFFVSVDDIDHSSIFCQRWPISQLFAVLLFSHLVCCWSIRVQVFLNHPKHQCLYRVVIWNVINVPIIARSSSFGLCSLLLTPTAVAWVWFFTALLCLSVHPHYISETDAARMVKLNIAMFPETWVLKPNLF